MRYAGGELYSDIILHVNYYRTSNFMAIDTCQFNTVATVYKMTS